MASRLKQGVLDVDQTTRVPFSAAKFKKPRVLGAAALGVAIMTGMVCAITYMETHVHTNPLLVVLFPFIAVFFLASLFPLLMYISYEEDFRNINPVTDYPYLAKKCYRAMSENNWKVSAKDI